MSDSPVPTDANPPKAAADPISVEELATVVLVMNRFLSKFAAMQLFTDAQINVADWTVLMILLEKGEAKPTELSWHSGIVHQRVMRITAALIEAGLVASAESGDGYVMSLTEVGKSRLSALNNTLLPLLKNALATNPTGLLTLKRTLVFFMRLFSA